jgi:N-acetylneuraminic acid mutarotase
MIVFGGNTAAGPTNSGARYNPVTDTWTPLPTNAAPMARQQHAAVWTGNEMLVWGGSIGFNTTDTGARWNPVSNTWTPLSNNNAPTPRYGHSAVWAGTEMIVWGGGGSTFFSFYDSGARYNPATDTWTPISMANAPIGRAIHRAAWNGNEMIVWGGYAPIPIFTGGRYNPAADSWTSINETGAPGVSLYAAACTQNKFIVWGGLNNSSQPVHTGAVYDLESDKWTSTVITNGFGSQMPNARYSPAACWTGTEMLIWGGMNGPDNPVADTYSYAPARRFYLYLKP